MLLNTHCDVFAPCCFGTFLLQFHLVSSHLYVDKAERLLLFRTRAATIKLSLVGRNSLIGQRGLSRLVEWEVGYTVITPTANLLIDGPHTKVLLDGGFVLLVDPPVRSPTVSG